jgi:diadenosine tetraphosphate (Ap4A) HIT family hydrolase
MPATAAGFELDRRIERDTEPLLLLGLCELRLMNDSRWPWLMLIPHRPGAIEIHDLTPLDQTMLVFEADIVAKALKSVTGCDKINTAALGNVVPQLHMHVVARFEGDPNWPGPVWGFGQREPYRPEDMHRFIDAMQTALSPS